MFGWFAPKCPLSTWEKTWTEWRLRWLADTLGIDRLFKAPIVLPNDEFFPDPYDATMDSARRMMVRVAHYMGVDAGPIGLEVCADEQLPGAAGHYDPGGVTIRVAASQLEKPDRLVATLAHELAHQILLGGGLLDPTVPDHERVTDLLTSFLGLGVFAANTVVHEQYGQTGQWSWWVIGKQGYLPARVFGYSFALIAFARGEDADAWAVHLRPDAAEPLRQGFRYLQKTGDSLFHPDTVRQRRRPQSVGALIDVLQDGSASARMSALWELREQGSAAASVAPAVAELLADPDPDIPGEAALTLGTMGSAARFATPHLLEALGRASSSTRAGAAQALGMLAADDENVVSELAALLRDDEPEVVDAAVGALCNFGHRAESIVPQLLDALTAAIVRCDDASSERLVQAIRAATPDPESAVRGYSIGGDPEMCQMALEALQMGS
jgi:hypothetical protein